jgi:plastocyanin
MERRAYLAGIGGLSLSGITGCLDAIAADQYDVGMSPTAFEPREYVTTVGSTVTWRNTSSRGHTVTAYAGAVPDGAAYFASGEFDSAEAARGAWDDSGDGILTAGEEFQHTPTVPGIYKYVCLPHEHVDMAGRLVVESEESAEQE